MVAKQNSLIEEPRFVPEKLELRRYSNEPYPPQMTFSKSFEPAVEANLASAHSGPE